MSYTAHVLTKSARSKILAKFPPKFPDSIAHHITVKFGVDESEPIPSPAKSVKVVGYVCDDSLEALVVEVNGKALRPDGKHYHITLSLDRSKGRKPVQSNGLIQNGAVQLVSPFGIDTKPELLN
jgi:hypothetical protein